MGDPSSMTTIPVCENGLAVALAMNQLRGMMPRTVLASPSRKTMSPSWSTLRPQRSQRAMAGVTGSGGSSPAKRACAHGRAEIIAGPRGRFHPVGRFRRALLIERQRDHPAAKPNHKEVSGCVLRISYERSAEPSRMSSRPENTPMQ